MTACVVCAARSVAVAGICVAGICDICDLCLDAMPMSLRGSHMSFELVRWACARARQLARQRNARRVAAMRDEIATLRGWIRVMSGHLFDDEMAQADAEFPGARNVKSGEGGTGHEDHGVRGVGADGGRVRGRIAGVRRRK